MVLVFWIAIVTDIMQSKNDLNDLKIMFYLPFMPHLTIGMFYVHLLFTIICNPLFQLLKAFRMTWYRLHDLRSPTKEAETTTNPIDRIVAHLLFHRHCSKVATETKEIILSTHLTLEPGELPIWLYVS